MIDQNILLQVQDKKISTKRAKELLEEEIKNTYSIRKAIVKYILSKRSCRHKWELMGKKIGRYKLNPQNKWREWTYRCKKCGKINKFSDKII